MYDVVENVILSRKYELTDMLKKIDTIWLQGDLTEGQRTKLVALAREKATPENSYAGLQGQVDTLFKSLGEVAAELRALTNRVTKLEGGEIPPELEMEEYPTWKKPTAAHDAYNTGDKMTYTDGKRYICKMDGVVWGPDVYPDAWEMLAEGEKESV